MSAQMSVDKLVVPPTPPLSPDRRREVAEQILKYLLHSDHLVARPNLGDFLLGITRMSDDSPQHVAHYFEKRGITVAELAEVFKFLQHKGFRLSDGLSH